jgi:hypothetical protein
MCAHDPATAVSVSLSEWHPLPLLPSPYHNQAASFTEQLAQDAENSLKIRTGPDLGNSSTSEAT